MPRQPQDFPCQASEFLDIKLMSRVRYKAASLEKRNKHETKARRHVEGANSTKLGASCLTKWLFDIHGEI